MATLALLATETAAARPARRKSLAELATPNHHSPDEVKKP
jgi:hypothetical protein